MGWVIKTPKHPEFCGCPPCPLCFDWQTEAPAGRVQDSWVQEIISGMTKFTGDMLGTKTPTPNEVEVLKGAAEAIHESNRTFGARVDAEFKAADEAQQTERQMSAFLAKKREDAARPPVKEVPACLDEMDLSKINDVPPQPVILTWANVMIGPSIDFASLYADAAKAMASAELDRPKPDDKERREIQAKEDAKKRMKAMARGYAKVGR